MALGGRLRDLAFGRHLRRRTVRFRLTALYCSLFFPASVALVAVTYVLIVWAQDEKAIGHLRAVRHLTLTTAHGGSTTVPVASGGGGTTLMTVVLAQHQITLDFRELLVGSCIVLVAMIGASVLFGWLAAGRVLRPLRVMTTTTRQISERNLHERLALAGPDDELKDLGDTIDGLLARLEAAFDSQQRFVANASHELRTPLMLSQTLLQVALADPAVTLDTLRAACLEAIEAGKDQAQLIDALLTLARSQRGLEHREPVDLTAIVHDALNAYEPSAAARGVRVDAVLGHAEVSGDARLISRLVSNLLDNAIRYNVTGGRVEVELTASTTEATLTVTNTGPPVPPDQISRLLEPFQRAAPERIAGPNGLGLGLSIIADVAEAHGASLEIRPRPEGGLIVAVSFPAPDDPLATYAGRVERASVRGAPSR
jgi:signal transduction histidine kinase